MAVFFKDLMAFATLSAVCAASFMWMDVLQHLV